MKSDSCNRLQAASQSLRWVPALSVPYAGWAKTGFDAWKFIKSKEDPTSIMNPEHRIFGHIKDQLGAKPVNERDTIGYKHTWSASSSMQLLAGILDWIFLYDPAGAGLRIGRSKTYEELINDGASGDRVSDHFPIRADIPLDVGAGR